MRYIIAASATMVALVHAVPQAIKVAANGPVFPKDITAEASSILKTMASQSPTASVDDDVTVTAKPLTVVTATGKKTTTKKTTVKKTTTTKHKTTAKKTTKKVVKKTTKKVVKKVKQNKRQAASSSASATTKAATTSAAATSPATSASSAAVTIRTTTTTTPTISASTDVGSACATQPVLQTYYPTLKDDASFLIDSKINSDANTTATAAAPSGYKWLWRNMMRTPQADSFMGAYTLPSYSASACGAICDSVLGCKAFNVYYERNPALNPADACPNPAPIANVVCTVWGSLLSDTQLTNIGQWRSSFAVVIAGSNGYNKI